MFGDSSKTYWKGKRNTDCLHGRMILVGNVIHGNVLCRFEIHDSVKFCLIFWKILGENQINTWLFQEIYEIGILAQ